MTPLREAAAHLRTVLRESPEPLAPRERAIMWVAAVAAALSRFLAVARTPWDWDEMLFSMGARDFDVTRHHPHPPGFPLFVAAGKVLHKVLALDEFRSLQMLDLLAAVLLFPALFLLFRESRAAFSVALPAALLVVFSPNVWFFGGTAFSDVPSLALGSLALALLLRSIRHLPLFPVGAGLVALSAAIRPQNLLLSFIPGLAVIAILLQRDPPVPNARRVVTSGLLLALVIVLGCYAGAAVASGGWPAYHAAVVAHGHYIRNADSFLSPERPSLLRVSDDFFERPYRQPFLNIALAVLSLIGLVAALRGRERTAAAVIAAAFLPLALASWLLLDFHSVSRFSIAYLPLPLLFAALGIDAISSSIAGASGRPGRAERSPLAGVVSRASLTGILLAVMVIWTLPALSIARSTVAPPVAAVTWVGDQIERRNATLSVSPDMSAYVQYLLPRFEFVPESAPAPRWTSRPGWFLTDVDPRKPAIHFGRSRGTLWNIVRQRYFDVWVVPIRDAVVFRSGWYGEEGSAAAPYRWMSATSEMRLPAFPGGATLYLALSAPGSGATPAAVTIAANGVIVERLAVTPGGVEVSHRFDAQETAKPLTITIHVDRTVRPSLLGVIKDDRDLGLRLSDLNWR